MSLTGSTTEQKIWNFLYSKIGNAYGVAGLMGNLYAESGLNSNNLQNTYNTKLGLTDAQYTEQVDNGTYTNFVKDSAGYGLAQWTYYSRKQNLLNYAQSSSASIGDLEMQLNFLYKELSGNYSTVLGTLKAATSVLEASNIVLTKFEAPADQGTSVQTKRAGYGQTYYDKYATTASSTSTTTTTSSSSVLIGHATYNENGTVTGGTAGDQTGGEVCTWAWYNKPWDYMAIYPDANVREKHAACCEAACANDKIGYDQTTRNTLQTQAKAVNYDYSKITTACACDCSAFQNSLAVASGSGATYGSNGWTTSNMKTALTNLGYIIITDTTYLTSADYCVRGAIYVKAGAHTVCGLTNGSKASKTLEKAGISTSTSSSSSSSSSSVPNYSGTGIGTAVAKTAMNIRTSANTSGTICGTISKGTAVEVLEVLSTGWYKIVWAGTSAGYAYTSNANDQYYTYTANATTSSSSSTTTTEKRATESAQSKDSSLAGDYTVTTLLNVRNGAGTAANSYGSDKSVLVAIPKGTVVHCYGYYTEVSGKKWLYVQFTYKNVKYTGFCSSTYLTKK